MRKYDYLIYFKHILDRTMLYPICFIDFDRLISYKTVISFYSYQIPYICLYNIVSIMVWVELESIVEKHFDFLSENGKSSKYIQIVSYTILSDIQNCDRTNNLIKI